MLPEHLEHPQRQVERVDVIHPLDPVEVVVLGRARLARRSPLPGREPVGVHFVAHLQRQENGEPPRAGFAPLLGAYARGEGPRPDVVHLPRGVSLLARLRAPRHLATLHRAVGHVGGDGAPHLVRRDEKIRRERRRHRGRETLQDRVQERVSPPAAVHALEHDELGARGDGPGRHHALRRRGELAGLEETVALDAHHHVGAVPAQLAVARVQKAARRVALSLRQPPIVGLGSARPRRGRWGLTFTVGGGGGGGSGDGGIKIRKTQLNR